MAALFERLGPVGRARRQRRRSHRRPAPGARPLNGWRALLDVNAAGAFLCTRAVLGGMVERGAAASPSRRPPPASDSATAAYTASSTPPSASCAPPPPRWPAPG